MFYEFRQFHDQLIVGVFQLRWQDAWAPGVRSASDLICHQVKSHTNTVFSLCGGKTDIFSSDTDGQMLPLSVHALIL